MRGIALPRRDEAIARMRRELVYAATKSDPALVPEVVRRMWAQKPVTPEEVQEAHKALFGRKP